MPGVWHCWRDNGHNAHRPILLRTFPVTSPWKIKAKAKTQREEKLQTSIIWVQPTVSSRRKRILTGHFYFCGPISLSLLHHEKNKNREYVKYIPHWWMNRNKRLHKRAQINISFEPQMTLSSCIHIIPVLPPFGRSRFVRGLSSLPLRLIFYPFLNVYSNNIPQRSSVDKGIWERERAFKVN